MFETIKLGEALDIIDSGAQFSIQFYTGNRKLNTGGKKIGMLRAVKSNEVAWPSKEMQTVKTDGEKKVKSQLLKDPHHFENRTRNIKTVGTENIRKLHIRLMTHLNGKKVIWGR